MKKKHLKAKIEELQDQVLQLQSRIPPRQKAGEVVNPGMFAIGNSGMFWQVSEPDLMRRKDVDALIKEHVERLIQKRLEETA